MAYMNKAMIIGNLGKDAEVAMTTNGRKCVKMTVATSRKYVVNGEKKEDTQWHNVVCWGKLADAMENLRPTKGTSVYVEGSICYRTYDKDGIKHNYTEITAENIQLLSSLNKVTSSNTSNAYQQQNSVPGYNPNDELPW